MLARVRILVRMCNCDCLYSMRARVCGLARVRILVRMCNCDCLYSVRARVCVLACAQVDKNNRRRLMSVKIRIQ